MPDVLGDLLDPVVRCGNVDIGGGGDGRRDDVGTS